jgi:hypothetical protein
MPLTSPRAPSRAARRRRPVRGLPVTASERPAATSIGLQLACLVSWHARTDGLHLDRIGAVETTAATGSDVVKDVWSATTKPSRVSIDQQPSSVSDSPGIENSLYIHMFTGQIGAQRPRPNKTSFWGRGLGPRGLCRIPAWHET